MSNFGRVPADVAEKAFIATILICLALQAWLAVITEIHWDEFFYLSQIYSYQRGELGSPLQKLHVHLLGWLTRLPGNEVDQVVVGRLFMLLCESGTCALIYLFSRLFFSRIAGLIAVLAFASATYTLLYGASFRADPLAAFLIMAALVVIARARPSLFSAVAVALLAATATLVTVKITLYAPAFLGVAGWRTMTAADRRQTMVWLGVAAVGGLLIVAVLYVAQLDLSSSATNASTRAALGNAAGAQTGAGLLPRALQVWEFFHFSPAQAVLLAVGAAAAVSMARSRNQLAAVAVLGCGATLLCLLFYRNAFPYFFPFILPPSLILAAAAVQRFASYRGYEWVVALGLVAPAIAVAPAWSARGQHIQRQTIEVVHRMFPQPVAYIDGTSLIASFPKRGPFMSSWGMSGYRRGTPIFAKILASETVPLLIIDGPPLEQAMQMRSDVAEPFRLLSPDELVLRENFVPQWGRIWVAGKRISTQPAGTEFSVVVPGLYTVEGASVWVDGRAPIEGAIQLARGRHFICSASAQVVTLRWGDHLYRPRADPSSSAVYRRS